MDTPLQEMTLIDFDAAPLPPLPPAGHPETAAFTVEPANAATMRELVRRELVTPDGVDEGDLALVAGVTTLDTQPRYAQMATLWTRLKAEIDRRRAYFAPRKARAHAVWQDVLKMEHDFVDALVLSERKAAGLLGAYDIEQRRLAEETRVQLEVKARASAAAEQFVAALDAEAAGAPEIAAEILAEEPMVAVASVPISTPQVAGMTTAGKWKAELAVAGNIDKLILEAADEIRTRRARLAATMLKEHQPAINALATSMKANLARIAGRLGLRVWEDRTPRRGRG